MTKLGEPIGSVNVFVNAGLAFTLLGVGGPPIFRVYCKLRRWLGSLLPRREVHSAYAQLHVYNPHGALGHWTRQNATLDPIIMKRCELSP